ncbi:MAG: ATP-binding cassette domain-containing protein [Polyangiales bacterium]
MGVTARGLVVRRGSFVLEIPVFEAGEGGTAVLGPNGAGKTTLLLSLQGLIPSEGVVGGARRSAAVFARPAVLRGTTLWNVSVVVGTVLAVDAAEADERARRALADVGLADAARADARALSTGQRQRLALARALACEPHALLLDEPFANVDADARPALRALVRSYADRSRCALVLATSSLADVSALCADVLVLRAGTLTHRGPVDRLSSVADGYVRALVAEAHATSR